MFPHFPRMTNAKQSRWPARLWIVRHGQSAGNVARDAADEAGAHRIALDIRDVDVPLSQLGYAQAEALGRWFGEGKGAGLLAAMDVVAAETGASLAQIALAWLAAQPGVTAPIASATRVEQLDELIGSWSVSLSPEQLGRLTAAGA